MKSELIFSIVIATLCLNLVWEVLLLCLNARHVRAFRAAPPDFFASKISLEDYQKSVDYTLAKNRFSIISTLGSGLFVLLLISVGWFGSFEKYVVGVVGEGGYWLGIVYVIAVSLVFQLFEIPFALYRTFVIEQQFGFNKTTFRLWCVDFFKGLVLSVLLALPVLWVIFWFLEVMGEWWWVSTFVFIALVQVFLMYLYPVVIAPLFNKFEKLDDGTLKGRIDDVANKTNFNIEEVFVMDGSKRSGHGNAYFTGFGSNKRVVLFDTLLQSLSEDGIVAVLAHEIGHQKKKHVIKLMVVSLLVSCMALWTLNFLIDLPEFYHAFGFDVVRHHGGLVLFMFVSSPFLYFLSPLFSSVSRAFEYEADRFAVETVGSQRPLSDALVGLSTKNLSNLTPHPWYSFFHYSHPTLLERLNAMERLSHES